MRIPTTKIYRAFSELDHFSDEQCEMLMRRIKLRMGTNFWVTAGIGALWVVMFVISIILIGVAASSLDYLDIDTYQYEKLLTLLTLIFILGFPTGVAMLVRDTIFSIRLTRAIDYEVDRVRCLKCKYILIGQIAESEHITCPECGERHHLAQLGITEADLIPPAT